jgi:hypothetical protein
MRVKAKDRIQECYVCGCKDEPGYVVVIKRAHTQLCDPCASDLAQALLSATEPGV